MRNLDRALLLARDLDQRLLATSLLNLGIAHIAAGATAEARTLIGEALWRYADLGDERFRARSLGYLGLAALVDGDPLRGGSLFAQSLSVFESLSEPNGIAEGPTGLGMAAATRGELVRAGRLGGAAERLRESFAGRPLPVERRLAEAEFVRARDALGAERWVDAWTTGRALRQEEAVAVALEPQRAHVRGE